MDAFSSNDLFSGLPHQMRKEIIESGCSINCQAGHALFREGEKAVKCFLVMQGRLKLVKTHEEGKESVVRYIGPGELTAAVAVFRERPYPVTALALIDSNMVAWDQHALKRLMDNNPKLVQNLLRMALDRMEDIQARFLELRAEKVEQRIARALLRIMKHAGRKTDTGIIIDLPLGRQDLADYTGTTLYTVSRTLSNWEKRGWIISGRERIVIADPHQLVLFTEQTHSTGD